MTGDQGNDIGHLGVALEKLRTRLLDTTLRNRLLNYRESARDIAIVDEMPDRVFHHLVEEGLPFYFDAVTAEPELQDQGDKGEDNDDGESQGVGRALPRSIDAQDVEKKYADDCLQTPFSERELERRLRKLYLEHRTLLEETGANALFLALGFLLWKEVGSEQRSIKSPLLLLPVRIEKDRGIGASVYRLSFDDAALDSNYTLLEKMRHDYGVRLPEIADESTPEAYWRQVEAAIASHHSAGWCVKREISLGLFRFHKQIMWHDLDPRRWPSHAPLVDKPIVQRLLLGPRQGDLRPTQVTEEYAACEGKEEFALISDADSSQYSAIVDALKQNVSLVIEGPPGTGKSQTITNLIAAAINSGKTVLFVAEKMAALDVVFDRLRLAGLDDFCLQLHGLKTAKKELLQTLKKRKQKRAESPKHAELRRGELEAARAELIGVSNALQKTIGPENLPLHEAVWRIERLAQHLPEGFAPIEFAGMKTIDHANFVHGRNLLNHLAKEWGSIPVEARAAWKGYRPHANAADRAPQIMQAVTEIDDASRTVIKWFAVEDASKEIPNRESSRTIARPPTCSCSPGPVRERRAYWCTASPISYASVGNPRVASSRSHTTVMRRMRFGNACAPLWATRRTAWLYLRAMASRCGLRVQRFKRVRTR